MVRKMTSGSYKFGIAITGIFLANPIPAASAMDWQIQAHVTRVEPSSLPDQVYFMVDTTGGVCPPGSWMVWNARGSDAASKSANSSGVLAVLLTALASGKRVELFGDNNAGNCPIEFVHILNS
jgi:hypothetical protein